MVLQSFVLLLSSFVIRPGCGILAVVSWRPAGAPKRTGGLERTAKAPRRRIFKHQSLLLGALAERRLYSHNQLVPRCLVPLAICSTLQRWSHELLLMVDQRDGVAVGKRMAAWMHTLVD